MRFSLLLSQNHIPVSNRAGFLIWPFMSRRAALNVEFPEILQNLKGKSVLDKSFFEKDPLYKL